MSVCVETQHSNKKLTKRSYNDAIIRKRWANVVLINRALVTRLVSGGVMVMVIV